MVQNVEHGECVEIPDARACVLGHRREEAAGRIERCSEHATLVTDEGVLLPTMVQPEGKSPMSFESWRNGARPTADELFGAL